ncbi:DUF6809 family protein [Clostridium sp. D33t1_170424_F3]|uniref:DUF6809 family protein n=1 Tax=Clostridium sp. D33t1_170424_F3 TaxID=2787099 RepID=UPI0018A8BFF3|nr:DUF6809 family protein [Clostridium sp. D33t1_170424_F3]
MVQMIEELYNSFYRQPKFMEEDRRLHANEALLKKNFSKWQKKILLRIIDDKNLVCDKTSLDSFAAGFCFGQRLATEVYECKGISSEDDCDNILMYAGSRSL